MSAVRRRRTRQRTSALAVPCPAARPPPRGDVVWRRLVLRWGRLRPERRRRALGRHAVARKLGRGLAEQRAECAEYYLTIPPADADKTEASETAGRSSRCGRSILTFIPWPRSDSRRKPAGASGPSGKGGSFYDAGVEARRRMAKAGLDVGAGEIWAVNELGRTSARTSPAGEMRCAEFSAACTRAETICQRRAGSSSTSAHSTSPSRRVQGDARGVAHRRGVLERPRQRVRRLLRGGGLRRPAGLGGPRASLADRTGALNDFFYHVPNLAQAGPNEADAARTVLERIRAADKRRVATRPHRANEPRLPRDDGPVHLREVYAMREYGADATTVPDDAIGFAWAPNPARRRATRMPGEDTVTKRLAAAIRDALDGEPIDCVRGWGRPAAARRAASGRPAARGHPSVRKPGRARGARAMARATAAVVHLLPRVAQRQSLGTLAIVSSSGWIASISSHVRASTPAPPEPAHRPGAEDGLVRRVLVVVDEDAPAALLLPPCRRDQIGAAALELAGGGCRRAAPRRSPTAARAT